ncbi:transcriptional adaptor 3 [Homalodisca vitripennis]|nr:transcriptional adaptor 3 [Homalodisca vitripennis]
MMKPKHSSKKGIGGKPHREHGKLSFGNGKVKESKNKAPESPEECALSFPDLRIVEKNQLPTFSQLLSRSKEEGVGMEDLDRIQLELEMLLTGVAVRIRDLNNEISTLNIAEERRDKKIKLALSTSDKMCSMGKIGYRFASFPDPVRRISGYISVISSWKKGRPTLCRSLQSKRTWGSTPQCELQWEQ